MTDDIQLPPDYIARIESETGELYGTGFLIDEKYVFTCAHTVQQALNVEYPLGHRVKLVFPFINPTQPYYDYAKVIVCAPKEDDHLSDIALLLLENSLKIKNILVIDTSGEIEKIKSFGYPSRRGRGFDGTLLDLLPDGLRLFQSSADINQGFSGAALVSQQNKNRAVVGMIKATDEEDNHFGYAIPSKYLNDILIQQKQKEEAISMCEEFVDKIFAEASQKPNRNGHVFLRRREILIYGWLLQNEFGSIIKEYLYNYVGPNQRTQIDSFLNNELPEAYLEKKEVRFVIFKDDLIQAILNNLKKPPIMDEIPGVRETGYNILRLFVKIYYENETKRPPNLALMMAQAFNRILNIVFDMEYEDDEVTFYRIKGRNSNWEFVLAVSPNEGAYTVNDLQRFAGISRNIEGDHHAPILLFAPNSENIEFYRDEPKNYYQIYHVWSISIAPFFSRLASLTSNEDDKEFVTQNFAGFFPKESRLDFKANEWMDRFEKFLLEVSNKGGKKS